MARPVIAILSRRPNLHSTRRLREAARRQGAIPRMQDPVSCRLILGQDGLELGGAAKRRVRPCVVIPRIGVSITGFGVAVVRQYERMGVPALNSSEAIARSRDKLHALQLLTAAGLPTPRTVVVRRRADVNETLERVGGPPVIAKLTVGTHGVGVMIAFTRAQARSLLEAFWSVGHEVVLVQEVVREALGHDLRALVVDGRVVAAMRREASDGDFRANLHRGGKGVAVTLSEEAERVAIAAARTLGLEVAGVDLLESARGPLALEVNSSPGFEGIEAATGVDVAGAIVERGLEIARR